MTHGAFPTGGTRNANAPSLWPLCRIPATERPLSQGVRSACSQSDLARRCDFILAGDVSDSALKQAIDRLSDQPHVQLRRIRLPADWPNQEFELVVLSELLYYLDTADLQETVGKAVGAVAPHGTLLSVHWRHAVPDYPQTGDVVQGAVEQAARDVLIQTVHHVEADFDLAVYVRPLSGETAHQVSVAGQGGLC